MKKVTTLLMTTLLFVFAVSKTNAQCADATGLNAAILTATSSTLTWTAVAGADNYDVNVQNGTGNPIFMDVTTNDVAGTSFIASGLTAGKNYKFKVRTNCGGDHSSWSPYFNFTAGFEGGGGTCDVPTGLSVTGITSSGAVLNWIDVDAATTYRVRVEDGSGNPIDFVFNASTGANSFSVSGLNAASNYKFKVRSSCVGDKSGWSAWKNFATAPLREGELTNTFSVFPNPATESINIQFVNNDLSASQLMIYDLTGKMVYQQLLQDNNNGTINIPVSDLAEGIYHIMLTNGTSIQTEKLIVTH